MPNSYLGPMVDPPSLDARKILSCENGAQLAGQRSVASRLDEVQARADGVRSCALRILTNCQMRQPAEAKEQPTRAGFEGRLNDVADTLNETESILQDLGAYLFD